MTVCGEKVTGVCVVGKCPHFKRCHPIVWDKYGKIKPKTNEEWFCQLPTEEKARWLYDHYVNARADEEAVADIFVRVNSGGQNLTEKKFIETLIAV